MSCKRSGKHQEDAQDLALWGLKFLPLGGALCLLGRDANIYEASFLLLPLLASRATSYDKALYWIQFSYTGDWLGGLRVPGFNKS